MSFPIMNVVIDLQYAITSDDFENFVRILNKSKIIFDELESTSTMVAELIVYAAEKSRKDFFQFLLPLLSPSHLYKALKFTVNKGLDPKTTYFSNGVCIMDETVAMLLYYGADACNNGAYDNFELLSRANKASDFVFEQIFLHTFDDAQPCHRIQLSTFLELVMNTKNYDGDRQYLIHKLLNYQLEFVVEEDEDRGFLFDSFIDMEFNLFEIIVRKSPNAICAILEEAAFKRYILQEKSYHDILKKMEYLVTKDFFFNHVVNFFENLDAFKVCETGIELVLFMIQYGLKCDTRMYHAVYRRYGDCVLFRTLLHLHVDEIPLDEKDKSVMASFISDINLSVQTFVNSISDKNWGRLYHLKTTYGGLTEGKAIDLLNFFVHPKLIDFLLCTENLPKRVLRKIRLLPRVPSLVELARDTLRKHIVDRFQINTTKQFYSIVNGLPIATEHRRIITFEKKLYDAIVVDSDLYDGEDENPAKRQRRCISFYD